jgi:hypothetical protein
LRLTDTGEIFVIEVNANCYLERRSEYATAAAAHGIDYPALLSRIGELALERWKHRSKAQRRRKRARAAALATPAAGGAARNGNGKTAAVAAKAPAKA